MENTTSNLPTPGCAKLPAQLTIMRQGEIRAQLAPDTIASGKLWGEALLQSSVNTENTVFRVVYEPGARSAWHSHPLGQILVILAGRCLVQRKGDAIQTANTGDIVWIAPDEMHWHGTDHNGSMTYLSVQAVLDGVAVHWGDHVVDAAAS